MHKMPKYTKSLISIPNLVYYLLHDPVFYVTHREEQFR